MTLLCSPKKGNKEKMQSKLVLFARVLKLGERHEISSVFYSLKF